MSQVMNSKWKMHIRPLTNADSDRREHRVILLELLCKRNILFLSFGLKIVITFNAMTNVSYPICCDKLLAHMLGLCKS